MEKELTIDELFAVPASTDLANQETEVRMCDHPVCPSAKYKGKNAPLLFCFSVALLGVAIYMANN